MKFITHCHFSLTPSTIPRGTNNHHLIDNVHMKLEQTNKKLAVVKRKCTKAAKYCLKMQMENVSVPFFLFL